MDLLVSLNSTVMACTNLNMINNLFSSQVALDMNSFLKLTYNLLEKYQQQIQPLVIPLPDLKQGFPPPLTLERENKTVLQELQPDHDNVVFVPAKKDVRDLSPPPVPRLRTHSRQAVLERERDKENSVTSQSVGGPLTPGYPVMQKQLDGDMEDIVSLLGKAKTLRQVFQARK